MALWEKKKKHGDEFESPVEELNLNTPGSPFAPPTMVAQQQPPPRPPEPKEEVPEFGIDKAIELMRKLPGDNTELVVQVVKTTLESLKVKVATIIEDANKKATDLGLDKCAS